MTSKVLRWGNSLGVRIPAPLARRLGLVEGTAIEIAVEKGRLVLEPAPAAPSLDGLLAGVTPENRHDDFEWWPADGREGRGTLPCG